MKPRSLLVPVFDAQGTGPAVRAACELATRYDATVVGLYVVEVSAVAGYWAADVPPQAFALQRNRLREEAAQAESSFTAFLSKQGVNADWRCEEGERRSVIDLYARHGDLVCLDAPREGPGSAYVEDLIFSTGRPVLVVPPTYAGSAIGDRVAIAWNSSREAARAQADAMGILSEAASVSLVTVVDPSMSDRETGVLEVDAGRLLARHGIELEAHTVHRGSTPVGEALHGWLHEQQMDLVVMGAYGHSRLREMVLGGATRWMLGHSTIPVLMSH
jgi:nucleotide-binding universal stress UspA family protein